MSQRVWLVTGCSSGLGEEFVRQILSRGDQVIATARKLETLKSLEEAGAVILQLDVTDNQLLIQETVDKAISIHGRIDVLVNNAGFITSGSWEDLEPEQLLAQFDTNVFGTMRVTRAVLPHFRQRRSGTMVFISSLSGWIGHPFVGAYAGSKFALEGLVESLSKETAHLGIKTLLIEPGRFRTKLLSASNLSAVPTKVPEHAEASSALHQHLAEEDQKQDGDASKAIKVILDLVRREGCAEGRDVPFRLPLGPDCFTEMKEKCEETLRVLEDWKPVITGTNFEE
ncbi:hypothetical protein MGN70_010581 [Eutypa lata]|nr:hypothetical protein MGN70_010581 [Eutypa lata]